MRGWKTMVVLIAAAALVSPTFGQDRKPVGVVSHVKVLSDKVPDVSSMEAWKKSYITDDMTDEQKMLAIWKTVVLYRSQDSPPNEYLQNSLNVHDPIKTFNVYGYGMCCCAASNVEALARYLGYEARGRIIHAHSVPEVFYNDDWHLLDGSLINYFRDEEGEIASVDEIIDTVQGWLKEHPEYADAKGNPNAGKLRQFARNEGWKKGPKMLADSPFYARDGQNLAGTHGWVSTFQEYNCPKGKIYEYGYSQGYQVNVQLRPGERLVRNWSNKGLHVNMKEGGGPGILGGRRGMGYQRKLGDIAPGRVGNGVLEYDVPLKDPTLKLTALTYENVAPADGGLRATDAKGTFTIRMPSSYVYLSGKLQGDAVVAEGGRIIVSFSDNNGTSWKHVETLNASGDVSLDLTDLCFRRYDYRLRFEMQGAGTGLDALKLTHDVQHAQTPLPALTSSRAKLRADRSSSPTMIPNSSTWPRTTCGWTSTARMSAA